jgi:hypothetical protein
MSCRILPGERPPHRAVPEHELLARLEGQRIPVGGLVLASALGHGIEAEGGHAFGRQLGVEPGLLHLVRDALGVLGHLREGDIGIGHVQAGLLEVGLQTAKAPQVLAESHEADVGLVAENGRGDDL